MPRNSTYKANKHQRELQEKLTFVIVHTTRMRSKKTNSLNTLIRDNVEKEQTPKLERIFTTTGLQHYSECSHTRLILVYTLIKNHHQYLINVIRLHKTTLKTLKMWHE